MNHVGAVVWSALLVAAVAARPARADEPTPLRRFVGVEAAFTSSDLLAVGLAGYPLPGLTLAAWTGAASLWNTRGVGASYTVAVARWHQRRASLAGGLAGVAQLRLGLGAAVKRFDSCVFACVDGDAVDGFVRIEAIKRLGANLGASFAVDGGVSRIAPAEDGVAAELYPYLGVRLGLVVGR